jgi:hypothetical protein
MIASFNYTEFYKEQTFSTTTIPLLAKVSAAAGKFRFPTILLQILRQIPFAVFVVFTCCSAVGFQSAFYWRLVFVTLH